MSAIALVPADLKVESGRRTAPIKSHRALMYLRTSSLFLSSVPLVVTKAMIPPVRSLSIDLAKK